VSLVLGDHRARSLRDEAERVLRAGLEEFTGIFNGPPRDAAGRPIRALTANISTGSGTEGDSDPGLVTVVAGDQPVFGFYTWQLTLLHELFHLWGAESFRYRDDREQWFNEGVAEYYMLRTATLRGIVARESAPVIAATAAGFYSSAAGLGRVSLREAGRTPANKRKHYSLVYQGGWLVATALDIDIRRRTDGAHSIDDLLRWLYARRDARGNRYGLQDLVAGLKAATGIDYTRFMGRYVDGIEVLPLREYVDLGDVALGSYRRGVLDTLAARGQQPTAQVPPVDPAVAAALGMEPGGP
jgi:predicted metalloprotease with PDZ domain